MKTLIVVSVLAFCVLGAMMTPVAAQQATGPACLQRVEFAEVVELQLILTGKSLTDGDAYQELTFKSFAPPCN